MKVYSDVQLLCRKRWQNHFSWVYLLFFFFPPIVSALCSCLQLLWIRWCFVADLSFSFLCSRLTEYYHGYPFWLSQLHGVLVWPQVHRVKRQTLLHPLLRQPVLKHMWWVQRVDRPWRKGEASILTWSGMQSAICCTTVTTALHKEGFQLIDFIQRKKNIPKYFCEHLFSFCNTCTRMNPTCSLSTLWATY